MARYSEILSSLVNKISRNQAFAISVIIGLFFFLYFVLPMGKEYYKIYVDREEKREIRKIRVQHQEQKRLDSLENVRRIKENEEFMDKHNKVNDLMAYLERRFPASTHISIYSIHNGGGVPKTGSEVKLSVLYTTDNIKGVNILKEYENMPLYSGYSELCYQMWVNKGKPFYARDIYEYPAIYFGETKNNMDYLGTRSLFGMWIKSSATHTYYISASFDMVDGMNPLNGSFPRSIMVSARERLVQLIDAK